jgi:hypothetical protein
LATASARKKAARDGTGGEAADCEIDRVFLRGGFRSYLNFITPVRGTEALVDSGEVRLHSGHFSFLAVF